jgi:hypothetical protein
MVSGRSCGNSAAGCIAVNLVADRSRPRADQDVTGSNGNGGLTAAWRSSAGRRWGKRTAESPLGWSLRSRLEMARNPRRDVEKRRGRGTPAPYQVVVVESKRTP